MQFDSHFWAGALVVGLVIFFASRVVLAWNYRHQQKILLHTFFLLLTLILAILGDAWWRGWGPGL